MLFLEGGGVAHMVGVIGVGKVDLDMGGRRFCTGALSRR